MRRRLIGTAIASALLTSCLLASCVSPPARHGTDSPPTVMPTPPGSPRATAGTPSPRPSPTVVPSAAPAADRLAREFTAFAATVDARVRIAVLQVGAGTDPWVFDDAPDPAWSTIKVALVIAAPHRPDAARRAIVSSDNAAADELWAALGGPVQAAERVRAVLADFGDPTTVVPAQRTREGFSAYGQTPWPAAAQVRFAARLPCQPDAAAVYRLMGQVSSEQRWGLGSIPGAHFKGGWGPDPSGRYLVRQFGTIPGQDGGLVAVSITVLPRSGTFDDGTAQITAVARWLAAHRSLLPSGRC